MPASKSVQKKVTLNKVIQKKQQKLLKPLNL